MSAPSLVRSPAVSFAIWATASRTDLDLDGSTAANGTLLPEVRLSRRRGSPALSPSMTPQLQIVSSASDAAAPQDVASPEREGWCTGLGWSGWSGGRCTCTGRATVECQ